MGSINNHRDVPAKNTILRFHRKEAEPDQEGSSSVRTFCTGRQDTPGENDDPIYDPKKGRYAQQRAWNTLQRTYARLKRVRERQRSNDDQLLRSTELVLTSKRIQKAFRQCQQNRHDWSLTLYEKSLESWVGLFGSAHPGNRWLLHNMAWIASANDSSRRTSVSPTVVWNSFVPSSPGSS